MRRVLLAVCLSLFSAAAFSQAQNGQQKDERAHFFLTAGLLGILNTHSGTHSAPSPILFSPGFGADIHLHENLFLQPRINLFYTYYLWNRNMALPAEVENRTATVPALLLDVPVVCSIAERGTMTAQAGGGLALLARFGILSNGVSAGDKNRDYPNRTAKQDVSDINAFFYQDFRWLYPELTGNIMFTLSNGWKVGASGTLYIPLGSIMSGDGLNSTMLNLCARLVY